MSSSQGPSPHAPRSIDEYLKQLRAALASEDPALIQDALYDAEEYLRAEIAANAGKSEADVLEIIASTYGAPEEVAAAYRDTEAKVKAAFHTPRRVPADPHSPFARFFRVFLDPRAYLSLFYMLLTLLTGILYFTLVTTGLCLSLGLSVLIIGVPVFLAFIGLTRALSLGEGRLLEAITGERMPRRPPHPGAPAPIWQRITEMLRDARTWTTLLYLWLMMPLGILYFVIAVVGLTLGIQLAACPLLMLAVDLGLLGRDTVYEVSMGDWSLPLAGTIVVSFLLTALGVVLLTTLMHLARAIAAGHAKLAKALLVEPGA
jgi:uncharacterized membrane protein